jgi:hypothetical protein
LTESPAAAPGAASSLPAMKNGLSLLCLSLLVACTGGTNNNPGNNNNNSDDSSGGDDSSAPVYTWSAVSIDFEDQRQESDCDSAYSQFLTFDVQERGYHMYSFEYASQAHSGSWFVFTTDGPGNRGYEIDFTINFPRPVRNLSWWLTGSGDGKVALADITTEDGEVQTVDFRVSTSGENGTALADLTDYDNIVSVAVYEIDDSAGFGLDDIEFELRDQ